MAYVIIDGGELHGLGGPLKLTIEHLGRVSSARRGLGGLGAVDSDARAALEKLFLDTTAAWSKQLDTAVDGTPRFPIVVMAGAKSSLKTAKEKIPSQVNPTGVGVIRDVAIPLSEVARRVDEFLTGYYDNLKAQLDIAQAATQRATMAGQLKTFRDALRTVVKTAAGEIPAAASVLPWWLLPLAGAGILAYTVRAFR